MDAPPRRFSAAYRHLFVALVGLLAGIVATVMLGRALQARQDPFPDSLMQVMARQSELLQASRQGNRCTAADALPRLQSLRALSNDLELAFPSLRDERRFVQHASGLRGALDRSLATAPADCAALAIVNRRIGDACQACHQDFR